MTALQWESAATDEPGDQYADSHAERRGTWHIGPAVFGMWSCELRITDDYGDEIAGAGIRLQDGDSEATAKLGAQEWEDAHLTSPAPLDTIDYCGSVCNNAVTQYAGEVCMCCGREWGEENGTCRGRHVNGDVWWQLLDAEDNRTNNDQTEHDMITTPELSRKFDELERLIGTAADLTEVEGRHDEYTRGQVELIGESMGLDLSGNRDTLTEAIRARAAYERAIEALKAAVLYTVTNRFGGN